MSRDRLQWPVLRIRNDLFGIQIQLWIFRVPDPCDSGSNPYYLCIFGNYKKTRIYQLSTMFYSISYYSPTVHIVYRIHRPKRRNKILIYLLCHFLLDPDQEKGPDPCESGSATLLKQFLDSRWNSCELFLGPCLLYREMRVFPLHCTV